MFRTSYLKYFDNMKEISHVSDMYLHSRLHVGNIVSLFEKTRHAIGTYI
jgi:hypothetical protein